MQSNEPIRNAFIQQFASTPNCMNRSSDSAVATATKTATFSHKEGGDMDNYDEHCLHSGCAILGTATGTATIEGSDQDRHGEFLTNDPM